jgi:hypothetical protein
MVRILTTLLHHEIAGRTVGEDDRRVQHGVVVQQLGERVGIGATQERVPATDHRERIGRRRQDGEALIGR